MGSPVIDTITFEYRSPRGDVTQRALVRWVERGHYLCGFDAATGAYHTFRKDRVLRYAPGHADALREPWSSPPPKISVSAPVDDRPQILFTGFQKSQRAELERAAGAAGLRVVKSVTTGLAFLCCGATAGPAKLARARERGVFVLHENDLHELLETGVLPDHSDEPIAPEH